MLGDIYIFGFLGFDCVIFDDDSVVEGLIIYSGVSKDGFVVCKEKMMLV